MKNIGNVTVILLMISQAVFCMDTPRAKTPLSELMEQWVFARYSYDPSYREESSDYKRDQKTVRQTKAVEKHVRSVNTEGNLVDAMSKIMIGEQTKQGILYVGSSLYVRSLDLKKLAAEVELQAVRMQKEADFAKQKSEDMIARERRKIEWQLYLETSTDRLRVGKSSAFRKLMPREI